MMDIEEKKSTTSTKEQHEQEKTIKLHPLAIINISDHHTRIKLEANNENNAKNSAVIGLLFGYQENLTINIMDSIEMEDYPTSNDSDANNQHIQTNIELHQTVFKHHEVIGWYRITFHEENSLANEKDLTVTHESIRNYNENPLFLLVTGGNNIDEKKQPQQPVTQEDKEEEKQLPITLYEPFMTNEGPRFRSLEFVLDTQESERIAVEKVFHNTPTSTNTTTSQLDLQFQSLTLSLESLDARISIILEYLDQNKNSLGVDDYPLLRHIDNLLKHYPPPQMNLFQQEFLTEFEDMLVLTGCATASKASRSVFGYVEKFKAITEKKDLKKSSRMQL